MIKTSQSIVHLSKLIIFINIDQHIPTDEMFMTQKN